MRFSVFTFGLLLLLLLHEQVLALRLPVVPDKGFYSFNHPTLQLRALAFPEPSELPVPKEKDWGSFLNNVESYISRNEDTENDWKLLTEVYYYCAEKHQQDDYDKGRWEHALGVAQILSDMKLDIPSISTALLRSVVEGNEDELKQINVDFGSDVFQLLNGLFRMDGIQNQYHQPRGIQEAGSDENFRKMMVTVAHDIRVILINLAEQTEIVRNFDASIMVVDRQTLVSVARETLHLYAPLAHRLGIYSLKTELEDTSLKFWKPNVYKKLQKMLAARQAQRQSYTDRVISILKQCLLEAHLKTTKAAISGRPKSLYSIYHKMQSQGLALDEIQDLMAFRILVDNVEQCYQILGIVHSHWKPVKGRIKDYIAAPKSNGYQSLHTTVIGPEDSRIEVQIRTFDMHDIAEGGFASHWIYKQGGTSSLSSSRGRSSVALQTQQYHMLRQLVEWVQIQDDEKKQKLRKDSREVEGDLFDKEVFVFSPQGQLIVLQKGSTILDYAYRIHSDLGNHCVGGKVDGKMVSFKHELKNGETIEILQSPSQTPKQEWLNIVRTSKAHSRIRSWLKKQQIGEGSVSIGREKLEEALKKYCQKHQKTTSIDGRTEYREKLDSILSAFDLEDENHLYQAVAYGQLRTKDILNQIFVAPPSELDESEDEIVLRSLQASKNIAMRTPRTDGVVIGGKRNFLISFCRNCNPLYGEDVMGVVTQGRGVKVHTTQCQYLQSSDPQRRVDAIWDQKSMKAKPSRATRVDVMFEDSPGMLAAMSSAISASKVDIGSVVLKTVSNGRGIARFELMLASVDDLQHVTQHLQRVHGVIVVERR